MIYLSGRGVPGADLPVAQPGGREDREPGPGRGQGELPRAGPVAPLRGQLRGHAQAEQLVPHQVPLLRDLPAAAAALHRAHHGHVPLGDVLHAGPQDRGLPADPRRAAPEPGEPRVPGLPHRHLLPVPLRLPHRHRQHRPRPLRPQPQHRQ